MGEARGAALAIGNLIPVLHRLGHDALEAQLHERHLATFRSAAAWPQLVGALRHQASRMAIEGRTEAARALSDEAAEVARVNDLPPFREAPYVLLAEGRSDEELELALQEARVLSAAGAGGLAALGAIDRIAISEAARGRVRRSLRLQGGLKSLAASAGLGLYLGSLEIRLQEAALAAAGPEATSLMAEGSRMSAEHLLEYALSDREDP